ncbi:MAG: TonB-dependent receptor [Burkholderiaceae bacterium]
MTQLDRVQVTGTLTPSKAELSADPASLPGSTTKVTQTEIAKLSVNSYGDLLRPVTGLNINNFGNGGLGYGFSLRGYVDTEHGKDIAVFVDGVPINTSSGVQANGYVDLNPLLPETISSFNVIRGPISALYGNHAFGGTIAFTTATEPPQSRVDISGGSYATGRVLGLYGYRSPGFQGYGALEGYYTNGYRDNGRDKRVNSFNKIAFPFLSGTASLRLQLFDESYGEPGYLNRAGVESGAISQRAAINATDHGLHSQQNLVFNYQGNGDAYWSSTSYVIHNDLARTRTSGGNAIPGRGSQRVDEDERVSFGADLHRTMPVSGLGMPALFVGGVSVYSDRIDATRFGADLRGNRTNQRQDRELNIDNPAIYGELQVKPVNALKVTAGARYDKFYNDIKSGGSDSFPNRDFSPKPGQFSPKGGAALTIVEGIELYANAARGLKAPSAYDELIANPNLNVSKLRSYETGLQGQDKSGTWRFVIDLWRTDQTGEVQNDPVTGDLINFGKTRRQGYDLEGRYRFIKNANGDTKLFVNYSRVSARIVGGAPGNDFVTTVPEYTATIGIDTSYAFQTERSTHRVGLYIYDSLVGSKHLDSAGQVNSRNYQRISAKLTYGNSAWKGVSNQPPRRNHLLLGRRGGHRAEGACQCHGGRDDRVRLIALLLVPSCNPNPEFR